MTSGTKVTSLHRADSLREANSRKIEVFTVWIMKNAVLWMLRFLALLITDVSEEHIASIIRVTKIGELGTTLSVTSNRSTRCPGV
jgi:hypothetical protein